MPNETHTDPNDAKHQLPDNLTDDLIKQNPAISKPVLIQFRELKKALGYLGVNMKSKGYTLSPPLGNTIPKISWLQNFSGNNRQSRD